MFLETLRDRVLDEMIVCRSIEEILERVTMEDFSDYRNYEQWLRANVISMWDYLYCQREPSGCGDSGYPIGFPIGG